MNRQKVELETIKSLKCPGIQGQGNEQQFIHTLSIFLPLSIYHYLSPSFSVVNETKKSTNMKKKGICLKTVY